MEKKKKEKKKKKFTFASLGLGDTLEIANVSPTPTLGNVLFFFYLLSYLV
jgi:hypothetical protein